MRKEALSLILGLAIAALALCNLYIEVRIQRVEHELVQQLVDRPALPPLDRHRGAPVPNS